MAPAATFKKFKKIFSPIALAMLFAKAILFSDQNFWSFGNLTEQDCSWHWTSTKMISSENLLLLTYHCGGTMEHDQKHTTPQRCCSQSLPGTWFWHVFENDLDSAVLEVLTLKWTTRPRKSPNSFWASGRKLMKAVHNCSVITSYKITNLCCRNAS